MIFLAWKDLHALYSGINGQEYNFSLTLFSRCVDCAYDSQCPGDQFCFGKVLPWVCNECRAPQPDGAWCLEDSQCENVCSGGRCGPCKAHADCPGDQFCRNL